MLCRIKFQFKLCVFSLPPFYSHSLTLTFPPLLLINFGFEFQDKTSNKTSSLSLSLSLLKLYTWTKLIYSIQYTVYIACTVIWGIYYCSQYMCMCMPSYCRSLFTIIQLLFLLVTHVMFTHLCNNLYSYSTRLSLSLSLSLSVWHHQSLIIIWQLFKQASSV